MSGYSDAAIALGPKAYYRLAGATAPGTIVPDASGNGADAVLQAASGTITSAAGLIVTDPADKAMAKESGGTFDRIDLPDVAALNIAGTALSLVCWVKGTTPGAFGTLLRKINGNTGYSLRSTGTGGSAGVHLDIGNGTNLAGVDLIATIWDGDPHLIAVTWDGSNARLYRDGAGLIVGPTALSRTMSSPAGRVGKLFNDEGFSSTNIVATIDEAAFFDKVLSAADVLSLWNAAQQLQSTGYADETSIRAALGKYAPGWSATSSPSVADGLARAEEASGEIDAILAARGITTPVTTPASFVARLRDLASLYAAARVAAGLFPQAAGPASTTYHEFLMRQYRAGLDGLRAGEIPTDVGTTTRGGPRSFWTSNPIDPETGEAWEPVFGRRTRW